MSDKKFDELFQEEKFDIDVSKKIKKNMNKKIYSKVIKSMIVVCLVITGTLFGVSSLCNLILYNPNREEKFLEGENYTSEFDVLMTTYFQMMNPGFVYLPATSKDKVQSLGFGRYQTEARIQSVLDQIILGPTPNTKIGISFSKIKIIESDVRNSRHTNEFKDPNNEHFQEVTYLQDIKKEIEKLPESAYIDAAVSFEDYISLDKVCHLIKKYPKSNINWIALKDQELSLTNGVASGMSLNDIFGWGVDKEKYPYFLLLSNEMTAETLKQKYLTQLKLLIDHPDFLEALSTFDYGEFSNINKLKDNYEKAQKELLAFGVRISIEKNDLLKMIEEDSISYVYIHDMKLSKYQK